ncbi:flagellar basal body P-ring protein FlgI [Planctomycetota bacterium]
MINKRSFKNVCLCLVILSTTASAERIKDIVDIQGVRSNPLNGVGLVVGLANDNGDKSPLAKQMLANLLRESGQVLPPAALAGGSMAAVIVTAELGPFDREGSRINVQVSTIGDAESLQGGRLLSTPLTGLDGQVYAVAQGGILLGGWTVSGLQSSAAKNHPTVGSIPDGAIVERQEIADFVEVLGGQRFITLHLRNKDFTTANRIGYAINGIFPHSCIVLDAGTIRVGIPGEIAASGVTQFIDSITSMPVQVDTTARVVINERTGTIVVGEHVAISNTAIAQGSLVVKVSETANVSQPLAPFSDAGRTVVVPESLVEVDEAPAYLIDVPRAVTVAELAKALNSIGATPRDLIAIFNALKESGALQAKLIIM